jgi:chromosome segregation ATPase
MASISKDQLHLVLSDIARQEEIVKNRRTELKNAQNRADDTSGLVAAAERAFNNADADYKVALEKMEAATAMVTLPEGELTAAKEVLSNVDAIQAALNKVVQSGKQLTAKTGDVVNGLQTCAADLHNAAAAAPAGHKSALTNAARKVNGYHTQLSGKPAEIQKKLDQADNEIQAIQNLPELTWLRNKIHSLEGEGVTAGTKTDPTKNGAYAAQIEKLRAERDNAKLAWRNAPDAERAAQDDLSAKKAALDMARRLLDEARAARDDAEQDIIERIDVAEPDDNDEVALTAIFVDEDFSPKDYGVKVKWTVERVKLTESEGTEIHVKTQTLPRGNYKVEAHLIPA